jgi:hypothetical protein
MDWKKWEAWKHRDLITVISFTIAYILTIPIRNYTFLNSIVDTTQGVPFLAHLVIIIIGSTIIIILLEIIAMIIRYSQKNR